MIANQSKTYGGILGQVISNLKIFRKYWHSKTLSKAGDDPFWSKKRYSLLWLLFRYIS